MKNKITKKQIIALLCNGDIANSMLAVRRMRANTKLTYLLKNK